MKKILYTTLIFVFMVLIGSKSANAIGNLNPSGIAGSDTQYSLNDIYTKITTGATTTEDTGTFSVPDSIFATFRTLTEIYEALPDWLEFSNTTSVFGSGYYEAGDLTEIDTDLIVSNIREGVNLFGVIGTLEEGSDIPIQSLSDSSTDVPYGTYATTTLDTVDSDLSALNIKSGTNLFGIDGTYAGAPVQTLSNSTTTVTYGTYATTTLDLVDSDLIAGNIKLGTNLFGIDGTVVNASDIPAQTLSNSTTSVNYGVYSTTTLDAVDADLTASNIKSGTNIFGVSGSYSVSVGPLKSGVTTSEIATNQTCADGGTGKCDDGYYKKGLARSYTDNADGTISDNSTKLMWTKCLPGLSGSNCGTGSATLYTLQNAVNYCEGLSLASQTDWRMPNVNEAFSLVDFSRQGPSINTTYFENFPNSGLMTSTKHSFYGGAYFTVTFQFGGTSYIGTGTAGYTLCVRNIPQ
jgi:hypothetical protein